MSLLTYLDTLTIEDAGKILGAIASVLIIAWGCARLRRIM